MFLLSWEFNTDIYTYTDCEQFPCISPRPGGLLTFGELSKIFSRNLRIAEIVLLMTISSWNFVRGPKSMLWAHVQSFSLKFLPYIWFLVWYIFARLFWRAHETLMKHPPDYLTYISRIPYPQTRITSLRSSMLPEENVFTAAVISEIGYQMPLYVCLWHVEISRPYHHINHHDFQVPC